MPCWASRKHTPVRSACVGTLAACDQLRPPSSEKTIMPRSPTATSRSPAAAMAVSSERSASRAGSAARGGSGAARTAGALPSTARSSSARAPMKRFLAHSAPLQHARLEVRSGALDTEVVGLRLLVLQTERKVTPVGQVHHQFKVGPQGGHVVVVDDVALLYAVQLPARVVVVNGEDLPGVLVHVQRTARVEVAHALLQGRVHDPQPVQFVARVVLVDVILVQQLAVLDLLALQLVGVVRHIHLLLAHELPVVALRAAVVHVELVI